MKRSKRTCKVIESDNSKIPIPTVKRLPSYLRLLYQAEEKGAKHISATMLATELGLKPIQVRKDISSTGVEGKPKIGFEISELTKRITQVLGWDTLTDAVIVGAGNLGSALAAYNGFLAYGLRVVAVFDKDAAKTGKDINGTPVLPVDGMAAYIKLHKVPVAIISVPAAQAQMVADMLVKAGVKGIWNFAPKEIKVPERIVVQRTDLARSFAVLSVKLRDKEKGREKPKSEPSLF